MSEASPWLCALRPYIQRDDFRVELATPIHMPSGTIIRDVAGVFLRFPKWQGQPFIDDLGKKAAGFVEVEGEHLFAELAVLRLLEKDGWSARWVNTTGGGGEVWKYLTDWRDVVRAEQRNRVIEEAEPRQLLARIAGLNKPQRYSGCWDVFAWRGSDVAFLECKRTTSKKVDSIRKEQENWLRSALYAGDSRVSVRSFCHVQWDYDG